MMFSITVSCLGRVSILLINARSILSSSIGKRAK
ncbi:Uncharacterised protein [Vibrio cholerae]|nr:Uncharacterised protein [Vibrio cholerae]